MNAKSVNPIENLLIDFDIINEIAMAIRKLGI